MKEQRFLGGVEKSAKMKLSISTHWKVLMVGTGAAVGMEPLKTLASVKNALSVPPCVSGWAHTHREWEGDREREQDGGREEGEERIEEIATKPRLMSV